MNMRIIFILLLFNCFFISGCGYDGSPRRVDERYIYKEFYDEEVATQVVEMEIPEGSTRIVLNVTITSGIVELTISDSTKDEVIEYAYIIDDYLLDEIIIDKRNRKDKWTYLMKKYEDTEGEITIFFY